MVRCLHFPGVDDTDSGCLMVVVDGLPLFGGSQLVVDKTLGSSLHSDGSPHEAAAAQRAEVPRVGGTHRVHLVRVGFGGWWQRWFAETRMFVAQLAKATVRRGPH